MTCTTPKRAWKYGLTENGKQKLTFKKPDMHWLYEELPIPCGQCISCKLGYARETALRAEHESRMHELNSFITLTYAPKYLPENGSLVPNDLTKFIKRLRYRFPNMPFKYLACGEYGNNPTTGEIQRPHYHLCLFGLDFYDKQFFKYSKKGFPQYISPTLSKEWKYGFHTINDWDRELGQYTARYNLKKVINKEKDKLKREYHFVQPWQDEYANTLTGEIIDQATYEDYLKKQSIQPEFVRMSQNLGKTYYEKYSTDADKDYYQTRRGKVPTPRAYDKHREKEQETKEFKKSGRPTLGQLKESRKEIAMSSTENSKNRLRQKHIINKQIVDNHNRSLKDD
jgi:hypothetical protein